MAFLLSVALEDYSLKKKFATAAQAVAAAWEICERFELEMPSGEWWVDTQWGAQICYNVMVSRDDDQWEPKEEFCRYMMRHCKGSGVKLEDDSGEQFLSISQV